MALASWRPVRCSSGSPGSSATTRRWRASTSAWASKAPRSAG